MPRPLDRLRTALAQARKDGTTILKIVHGYGSSGVGGVLRPVVRNFLRQSKEKGEIRLFVNGETLSSFDERSKALVAQAPQLLLDSDFARGNKGITLVCCERKAIKKRCLHRPRIRPLKILHHHRCRRSSPSLRNSLAARIRTPGACRSTLRAWSY